MPSGRNPVGRANSVGKTAWPWAVPDLAAPVALGARSRRHGHQDRGHCRQRGPQDGRGSETSNHRVLSPSSLFRSGCNPWLPLVSTVEPRERIHRRGTSVELASRRHRFDQVAQRSPGRGIFRGSRPTTRRGRTAGRHGRRPPSTPSSGWSTSTGNASPDLDAGFDGESERRSRRRANRLDVRARPRVRPAASGTAAAGCPPSRGRSATGRSRTSRRTWGADGRRLLRPRLPMPASSSAGETARPRRP